MSRAAISSLLGVLALAGCGATSALFLGPQPRPTVGVIEGYSRFWGLFSERAEIVKVDRPAEEGISRATLGNVTRAQVAPGERCVELEIKKCTALEKCSEATSCAFSNYFIAGQHVQLKPGSLKLDQPASAGDTANGTLQAEISAEGFASQTRRIKVVCGAGVRGVCERGTPELPRQPILQR